MHGSLLLRVTAQTWAKQQAFENLNSDMFCKDLGELKSMNVLLLTTPMHQRLFTFTVDTNSLRVPHGGAQKSIKHSIFLFLSAGTEFSISSAGIWAV